MPATDRSSAVGALAVAVTGLLWGTTGTAATFAPEAGPLAIGSAALGVGGILQALIAIGPLRAAWPAIRARWGLVALGAVAVAIYPLAFYSSMHLAGVAIGSRSEEHTSELQSRENLVCRLLLEKKKEISEKQQSR